MKARRVILGAALVVVAALLGAVGCSTSVRTNLYSTLQQDNNDIAPFEIADGLYYVGSSDIAVFALRTRDGVVLIDSGYEFTAQRVPRNLERVGLNINDVRIVLNTHAHMDHAAGLAFLKEASGAQLYASPLDAAQLEAGGRGDFFLGDWMGFAPVEVDHELQDGEVVRLGERELTAHFTPGHTKGCTSWSFPIEVDGREVQALVICSMGILYFDLTDNPKYPAIAADFQRSFDTLRGLRCDLFLGAHGNFFDMRRKREHLGQTPNPFIDPDGCRAYIDRQEAIFQRALARQQGRPS